MRKRILAIVFAAALLVAMAVPQFGGSGTAEAVVHPVVPICNALAQGSAAGGGPAFPLPSQAGSGAGGPGAVAQGEDNSGDNSPDAPIPGEGCP